MYVSIQEYNTVHRFHEQALRREQRQHHSFLETALRLQQHDSLQLHLEVRTTFIHLRYIVLLLLLLLYLRITRDCIMAACANPTQLMSSLIPTFSAVIAALHFTVGIEVTITYYCLSYTHAHSNKYTHTTHTTNTHIHTYVHTYTHTNKHTNKHKKTCKQIHTNAHTHINIYM